MPRCASPSFEPFVEANQPRRSQAYNAPARGGGGVGASPDTAMVFSTACYNQDPTSTPFAQKRYRWDAFKWDGPVRSLAIACLMEVAANFLITFPASLAIIEALSDNGGRVPEDHVTVVALAYGIGITMAVICFLPVAGGPIHSAFMVVLAIFGLLPWWKVPFLFASQVLGCLLADLLAVAILWNVIDWDLKSARAPHNDEMNRGIASAVSLQKFQRGPHVMLHIFLAEVVTSALTGIVFCSLFDSSNALVSDSIIAPLLGTYFFLHILSSLPTSALGHPAHDLGCRLSCMTVFGDGESCFESAATVNALLTPILGMFVGVLFYVAVMADSRRLPARVQIARKQDRVWRENKVATNVTLQRAEEIEDAERLRRVNLAGVELADAHPSQVGPSSRVEEMPTVNRHATAVLPRPTEQTDYRHLSSTRELHHPESRHDDPHYKQYEKEAQPTCRRSSPFAIMSSFQGKGQRKSHNQHQEAQNFQEYFHYDTSQEGTFAEKHPLSSSSQVPSSAIPLQARNVRGI